MKDVLEQNINWLLIRASIPAKQTFMKLAEEHGLTHMQLFTLCLIDDNQEMPMQAIRGTLGCDASNTTGIVERLVAGKFIERSESIRDRRIKMVKLTDKGKWARATIMEELGRISSPVLTHLTKAEADILKMLLARVITGCVPKRHVP